MEKKKNIAERNTNGVERNTKTLQKEIQMDVERNTNGCGPSYQPAADGGWMVAATSHKTNMKEKSFAASFQNNSQANSKKLDIYDA